VEGDHARTLREFSRGTGAEVIAVQFSRGTGAEVTGLRPQYREVGHVVQTSGRPGPAVCRGAPESGLVRVVAFMATPAGVVGMRRRAMSSAAGSLKPSLVASVSS
jgi:hypothetical protein